MIFKSWTLAVASLITGIFIDLDHIADVVREHGWSTKIKEFFYICNNAQFERVVLFCHGWEWLLLWSIAAWLTDWNHWITGAVIGIGHHLVLDTFHNSSNPYSYSLLWRWKHDFDFNTTFSRLTDKKYNNKYFADKIKNN